MKNFKFKNLILVVCVLTCSFCAWSQVTIIDHGSCGNSLTWVLTDDSVLTISGNGDMADYIDYFDMYGNYHTDAPWYFHKHSFTVAVIGDSVATIGNHAFDSCINLTSITIPNSVTSLGDYAFKNCINLTAVTIPHSVTSLGNSAFRNCDSLTSITIPNSIINWGDYVFDGCGGLTSVIIEDGVTSIGQSAFIICQNLTSITIPNSVTSIGESAFSICESLMSIILPDSLTSIASSTFAGCKSLTSITIPSIVTTIEHHAFYRSGLTSINIPNSVTNIETNAFTRCDSLTSVVIGNSVTTIEYYAFYNCSNLSSVIVYAVIPPILVAAPYSGGRAFDGVPNTIPIYIPCGTYNDYRTGWSYFSNFIEPARDTNFYSATFQQGETYSDSNFTNLTQAGRYCTTLQNDNGCDSVVCLDLTYETGIEEIMNYELQVTSYEIYDILGRKHVTRHCGLDPQSPVMNEILKQVQNDVLYLANGIYMLKLYTNQGIITKKVIKL